MLIVTKAEISAKAAKIITPSVKIDTPHRVMAMRGKYGKRNFLINFLVKIAAIKTVTKI